MGDAVCEMEFLGRRVRVESVFLEAGEALRV